jgi:nucleoside-triphosphatase THEP1
MAAFYPNEHLSEKWMKASVVGSLWAVVEIVLGSLLHNLKIPLSGSILSFITVYLIIAFFQLWKINGIIWRSGLICALMKSLSPSSILLGPMIGILLEALILEVTIRIIGKNTFAYAVGGALAVFSVLIQKACSLLILYGWDFVTLLGNMYLYAANQLRFESVSPKYLLIFISGIYLINGSVAGILGYKSGKSYLIDVSIKHIPLIKKQMTNQLLRYTTKQNHSLFFLFLILIMLIVVMLIVSNNSFLVSAGVSIAFTAIIALRYRQSMRFMKKLTIWVQLSFILLFSATFYNGFSINGLLQMGGWIIGLKMVFRAMVLLTAFSAISKELQNPVVKNVLYKKGMKNLYQSLELAFAALPGLMETFSLDISHVRGFRKFIFTMLSSSQSLLEDFINIEKSRPTVFVISGKINEGKTTLTQKVVTVLKERGIHVHGLLSVANGNKEDGKSYYVEDIDTNARELLCSENPATGNIKVGRFHFSATGVLYGRKILEQAVHKPNQLIVIDEIGPLEINDNGWAPAIHNILNHTNTAHLWTVREKLVKLIIRKWNIGDVYIFNLDEDTPQDIAECICCNINPSSLES